MMDTKEIELHQLHRRVWALWDKMSGSFQWPDAEIEALAGGPRPICKFCEDAVVGKCVCPEDQAVINTNCPVHAHLIAWGGMRPLVAPGPMLVVDARQLRVRVTALTEQQWHLVEQVLLASPLTRNEVMATDPRLGHSPWKALVEVRSSGVPVDEALYENVRGMGIDG